MVDLLALVENRTENTTANLGVRITFDPSLVIEEVTHWPYLWRCQSRPGRIDCTNPEFTIGADGQIRFTLRMPEAPAGGDYDISAVVTSSPADPDPSNTTASTSLHVIRQHIVSSERDSGPGSLRNAIEEANAWCRTDRPCEIRFRFPEPPLLPVSMLPVLKPLSPLPPLTACGVVVGDRPLHVGDPVRMQAEIRGHRVAAGPGLELRSACTLATALYGITINGFPGDGIVITAPALTTLSGVAVGTDAAGTRALPNGGRGIAQLANSQLVIFDSLIGGNARSGVALFNGSATIARTLVGIGRDGRDLGNGASGIFVAPGAFDLFVSDSVIANHPHYGLALAGRRLVNISPSTIVKDNISDVDWFLDGPTADPPGQFGPPTPRVLSATYDAAANITRVTVSLEDPNATAASNLQIRLYASDRVTIFGTAHLASLVGTRWIEVKTPVSEPFTIAVAGDLRGKSVSAVTTVWNVKHFIDAPEPAMLSTSEVSMAVKVE